MNQDTFINKNSNSWSELNSYTEKINKKGINKLNSKEIKRFLYLFRQTSHQLAYARTHYPDSNTVKYLNSLVSQAHNHTYSVKKDSLSAIFHYITYGFPAYLKKFKNYILAAFLVFLLGFLVSLIMVAVNSSNASFFLPKQFIDSVGKPRSNVPWNYPLVSSQIMTNNILVALKAFVFGITLGIGTIYVLFQNGAILGALTALTYQRGNPLEFWSLILPHGIIELTAIFISGAAGLLIAYNLLIPKQYSRKHSLIYGAKQGVSLIFGIILLLIIAGIIEGFFTPLNLNPITKLIFALGTAALLLFYFSRPYFKKNR